MKTRTTLLLLLALPLSACSGGQAGGTDGENAVDTELRQCADGPTVAGLDVSYYQGVVDWAAVRASGRAFAIARVADGWFKDPKFDLNWQGMGEQGLYRGSYMYFRASQDPIAQAQLLLDAIGPLGEQDLPPAIDLETLDGMPPSTVVARAQQWLDHVEAALGRRPMIYIAAGFADRIGNPAQLADAPLWVANWNAQCPRMPSPWGEWKFWQTRAATAPGVHTSVDLDVWNGTRAELAAYAGPAR
jgi:lysozyme